MGNVMEQDKKEKKKYPRDTKKDTSRLFTGATKDKKPEIHLDRLASTEAFGVSELLLKLLPPDFIYSFIHPLSQSKFMTTLERALNKKKDSKHVGMRELHTANILLIADQIDTYEKLNDLEEEIIAVKEIYNDFHVLVVFGYRLLLKHRNEDLSKKLSVLLFGNDLLTEQATPDRLVQEQTKLFTEQTKLSETTNSEKSIRRDKATALFS